MALSDRPVRTEAGSPDLLGAIASATAVRRLRAIGPDATDAHERDLASYARSQLLPIDGITVTGRHHHLVAAVLAHEHGDSDRTATALRPALADDPRLPDVQAPVGSLRPAESTRRRPAT